MPTDPNTVKNYNESAQAYHTHISDKKESPWHSMYEKPAMLAELPDLTDKVVISIGCGSGVDILAIKERGPKRVVGIDISEGLINIAKTEQPETEFYVMDMEQLEFADETFDLAYSSLAIHYLPNWDVALSEAYRVLKPGGMYIFSCGHPFDGAMERGENEQGRYGLIGKQHTNDSVILYGDYFNISANGVKELRGILSTADVLCYQRPLSAMFNDIINAGFSVTKIVEPLPTKEFEERDKASYDYLNHMPDFMIFVCQK